MKNNCTVGAVAGQPPDAQPIVGLIPTGCHTYVWDNTVEDPIEGRRFKKYDNDDC